MYILGIIVHGNLVYIVLDIYMRGPRADTLGYNEILAYFQHLEIQVIIT